MQFQSGEPGIEQEMWSVFDSIRPEGRSQQKAVQGSSDNCVVCSNPLLPYTLVESTEGNVMCACGHIVKTANVMSHYLYEDSSSQKSTRRKTTISKELMKVQKIDAWLRYSGSERKEYKLRNYTTDKCSGCLLTEPLTEQVVDVVNIIFTLSMTYSLGSNRARVKDAIILVIIKKICEKSGFRLCCNAVKSTFDLQSKHITKAEKIVVEMMYRNDQLRKFLESDHDESVLLHRVKTKLSGLGFGSDVCDTFEKVLRIVQDKEMMLDNTPSSIMVACLYLVAMKKQLGLPPEHIGDVFKVSGVTVTKNYKKLLQFQHEFEHCFSQTI